MFTGMSLIEFTKQFQDNSDCISYLRDIKFKDGVKCKKCNSTQFWKGKCSDNVRCKQCGYEESPTAGTVFHKIKFPLLKAFHICYRVSVSKKGMSSWGLSRELDLRQMTCWAFKRKIQEAMASGSLHPLEKRVDVDEMAVGGHDESSQGRSKADKKLVSIALEVREDGEMGRAYGRVISNYSSEELVKIFDKHISKENVRTDKWRGYSPLQSKWNIEMIKSEKGKKFPQMHILIMNLKSWLRGIHHKCSEKHVQAYLNEFFYRFNRRGSIKTIFHNLVVKMINTAPIYHTAFTT